MPMASVSIFLITRTNKPKKPIQPAAKIKTGQRQAPTNKKTAGKKTGPGYQTQICHICVCKNNTPLNIAQHSLHAV